MFVCVCLFVCLFVCMGDLRYITSWRQEHGRGGRNEGGGDDVFLRTEGMKKEFYKGRERMIITFAMDRNT